MLIGYARVSTEDQKLDLQLDALQQAGCVRIYEEKMTGRNPNRPVLQAVIESLQPGDTLVVWKLSRLGRSMKQLVDALHWMVEKGIGFKSLQEAIDVTSMTGKVLFYVLAIVAESEAVNGAENTKAGIAAYRARGNSWGPHLLMDDAMIAKARLLLTTEPRWSVRQICEEYHVSKATLYRNLSKAA